VPQSQLIARKQEVGAAVDGFTLADLHGEARRLTFPILHDPNGVVARQWFTEQTPRVFLLDAGRVLRYRGAIQSVYYILPNPL
jgi:hypothetical protein